MCQHLSKSGFVQGWATAGVAVAINYRAVRTRTLLWRPCRSEGERAEAFAGDFSLNSAVQGMVHQVGDRLGQIDILINNAGVAATNDVELTEEDFDRTRAINLKSAFLCTRTVLPGMRAKR
jgi:3-oxoacyl-[acyl-carrier protein] reductase